VRGIGLLALALAGLHCGNDDEVIAGAGGRGTTSSTRQSASATTGSASAGQGGGATSGWIGVAPLRSPRQENAVVALDGEIYVIGGFDEQAAVLATVEAYDPATDSWRNVAPLPEPRHHVHAAVAGGKLYVLGGLKGLSFAADGDSWVYDPGGDTWTPVADMPAGTERGGGVVGAVGDELVVAGGLRQGAVTDVSAYHVTQDSWRELAPLPEALDHLAGGAVGNRVYALGGRNTGIEAISGDVYVYDHGANTWSTGAPMLVPRGGTAGAVVDGRLYVFGGEGNLDAMTGVFADVSSYDPVSDRWTALQPMPSPRHGTGAAAIDGIIYVPGGATTQAFGAVADHAAYIP